MTKPLPQTTLRVPSKQRVKYVSIRGKVNRKRMKTYFDTYIKPLNDELRVLIAVSEKGNVVRRVRG